MIEIVLRDDLNAYEPKPIFGLSYRTLATCACVAVACVAIGVALLAAGVSGSAGGPLILLVGGAIGFVGVGKVDGLRAEVWWRVWREDSAWGRCALYSPVRVVTAAERTPERVPGRRRDRRRHAVEPETAGVDEDEVKEGRDGR